MDPNHGSRGEKKQRKINSSPKFCSGMDYKWISSEQKHVGIVGVQDPLNLLSSQLEQFWKIEEVESELPLSKEEQRCEDFFKDTHSRDEEGRYIVRLPFNDKIHELGNSKRGAIAQFLRMERKMERDPIFAEKYREFMREYEQLGHMKRISEPREVEEGYYTPHHGVFSSNKFRIVFNASAPTTGKGISLNDAQMVGAKLQRDIFDILIDFRQGEFGYTGDIEKMYRQVLVDERDCKYQKIIWRPRKGEPLHVYELKTVTYGHAAAPHCAIRTMIQCARDHENLWPHGAGRVMENFYVDDLIMSCDSEKDLRRETQEVIGLLARGKMRLVKERKNIPYTRNMDEKLFDFQESKPVLGILWETGSDQFRFRTEEEINDQTVWTKRGILSKISRIFDPLGLVTPITLVGKMLMQELWKSKIGWDEAVTGIIRTEWGNFLRELPAVNNIKVPRWIGRKLGKGFQLHGFCDASSKGYGAAIYTVCLDKDNWNSVHLLTAKSKFAPLSGVTIPRLELNAAHLLIRLMARVTQNLWGFESIHCWSDSEIALYWIYGTQRKQDKLKVYVANRVASIQNKTEEVAAHWHWVPGEENPADLASRGVTPTMLVKSKLWWHGPEWLEGDIWKKRDSKFKISEDKKALAEEEMKGIQDMEIIRDGAVTLAINHGHIIKQDVEGQLKRGPWYKHKRQGKKHSIF